MPRYAAANKTINDLKKKINSYGDIYNYVNGLCAGSSKVISDLSKINIDFENVDFINKFNMSGTEDIQQYEMINNIPIAWCAANGNWQLPVVFCLYIGEKNEIRGYIPENGNCYDHKNKCTYANHISNYILDSNKLRNDVKTRIQIKGINNSNNSTIGKNIPKIMKKITEDSRVTMYKNMLEQKQITGWKITEKITDLKKDLPIIRAFKDIISWDNIEPTLFENHDIEFMKLFFDEFYSYIDFYLVWNDELYHDKEFVLKYGESFDFSEGGSDEMFDYWKNDKDVMNILQNVLEWDDIDDDDEDKYKYVDRYEDTEDTNVQILNISQEKININDNLYFINIDTLINEFNNSSSFNPQTVKQIIKNSISDGVKSADSTELDEIIIKDNNNTSISVKLEFVSKNKSDLYSIALNELSARFNNLINYLNSQINSMTF